jgi:hypothetical protein
MEGPGRAERAVDLVGRDVQESESPARAGVELRDVVARGVEQLEGAADVGLDEGGRPVDRAVDVGLGGEVEDRRGPVLVDDLVDRGAVGDVGLHEMEARVLGDVGQALEVPGVGQLVDDDDARPGARERQPDEIRPDEARSAGDDPGIHAQT